MTMITLTTMIILTTTIILMTTIILTNTETIKDLREKPNKAKVRKRAENKCKNWV